MKMAIVYGSSLGNTAEVAKMIKKEFNMPNNIDVYDVNDVTPEILNKYDKFIFGTSTWGIGEMQPSWEKFNFKKLQLKSKTIALFGLGDSQIYSFTFCNGLYKLYKKITICKEIKLVGQVDSKQYKYSESKAVIKNKFIGLVLDYDNFPNDVPKLIKKWVKEIKKFFI